MADNVDLGQEVQERHRFDENALLAYLEANIPEFKGPLTVRQFGGGQSNPTYVLITPDQRYVLRRKPPGKLLPSAHAVDREFRVISAVYKQDYPVPRPYLLCEDESVIGTIFYIMDFRVGRVYFDRSMPDLQPSERGVLLRDFLSTQIRLHKMDYKAMGLEDFGRPGNYFSRQINRWSKQYQMSETDSIPAMDELIDWLPKNVPEDGTATLIHGDYSLHNVMTHPQKPKIIAVLDWELSTIGHPLGDLFYSILPWYSPLETFTSKTETELREHGVPTLQGMIELYAELGGLDATQNQSFYQAYTLFRLASILQGIVGRVRDGTASNPRATEIAANVKPLAEAALSQLQSS